uniref:DNA-directed RNA polymerase n=1 Tax=Haematococcus lacustris TaxID=44745 RepID=A0A2K9YS14_HAELA|nr:DNA-directed RNA polymerase subunit beta'' [Haematococcus lacustris]AUW36545.1 DNA-directed RNA polymerase subunit beta'' [Haematococcus lacustris]
MRKPGTFRIKEFTKYNNKLKPIQTKFYFLPFSTFKYLNPFAKTYYFSPFIGEIISIKCPWFKNKNELNLPFFREVFSPYGSTRKVSPSGTFGLSDVRPQPLTQPNARGPGSFSGLPLVGREAGRSGVGGPQPPTSRRTPYRADEVSERSSPLPFSCMFLTKLDLVSYYFANPFSPLLSARVPKVSDCADQRYLKSYKSRRYLKEGAGVLLSDTYGTFYTPFSSGLGIFLTPFPLGKLNGLGAPSPNLGLGAKNQGKHPPLRCSEEPRPVAPHRPAAAGNRADSARKGREGENGRKQGQAYSRVKTLPYGAGAACSPKGRKKPLLPEKSTSSLYLKSPKSCFAESRLDSLLPVKKENKIKSPKGYAHQKSNSKNYFKTLKSNTLKYYTPPVNVIFTSFSNLLFSSTVQSELLSLGDSLGSKKQPDLISVQTRGAPSFATPRLLLRTPLPPAGARGKTQGKRGKEESGEAIENERTIDSKNAMAFESSKAYDGQKLKIESDHQKGKRVDKTENPELVGNLLTRKKSKHAFKLYNFSAGPACPTYGLPMPVSPIGPFLPSQPFSPRLPGSLGTTADEENRALGTTAYSEKRGRRPGSSRDGRRAGYEGNKEANSARKGREKKRYNEPARGSSEHLKGGWGFAPPTGCYIEGGPQPQLGAGGPRAANEGAANEPLLNQVFLLGNFIVSGDIIGPGFEKIAIPTAGQIIHYNKEKITLRQSQPIFISPKGILHKFDGDFIDPKTPVITLSYQRLKTGDIIQGIPKVEQYFEARTTKRGRLFRDSLPSLLRILFKRYCAKYPLEMAVRQCFYKIQQIVVDGVHRVYKSQGVTISDKHIEIIVKQMTCKVRITDGAQTGFFPGEILELSFIEKINKFLMKKITYEPLVLGITKASLEVDSFLSAASFQQTTRVLSKAAIFRKKDFLKGLKENVILGNLIPAGTGYLVSLDDKSMNV